MNFINRLLITTVVLFLASGTTPSWAEANSSVSSAASSCQALESADFSQILDAPTQIIESKLVDAAEGLPAMCLVKGFIASHVGIELRLPIENWNGKFLEVGCGGHCGSYFSMLCSGPLRKGYACIASDMGHKSTTLQAAWAYNNLQAQIDWGFRAAHVTALAGKAITQEYYHNKPARSYFLGCSTGGREGLVESQRFPWDFNGIAAGAAVVNSSGWTMDVVWAVAALTGKDGNPILSNDDAHLLHAAVVAKCDMDDGVKDGIISNPMACKFDPAELQCKGSSNSSCLTAEQVNAVKKVYSGPPASIVDRTTTMGAIPGSELNWVPGGNSGSYWGVSHYMLDLFAYSGFWPAPGPSWRLADFDFTRDYKRLGMYAALANANNPDLRKFAALGGKLIGYFGLQDESPPEFPDYYETVERTMGGRAATQDFFRLFMIPGMDHCFNGAGAFSIDYLSYLEAWVEKGQVPDKVIGSHADGLKWGNDYPWNPKIPVAFTRPIYPYPIRAKYKGRGDPNDAANFVPVSSR
jgi:feruloyl esterase